MPLVGSTDKHRLHGVQEYQNAEKPTKSAVLTPVLVYPNQVGTHYALG